VLNAATITIAILNVLQGDAALAAVLPDGAWFAEAPPGSTRFVIVQLISASNVPMFGGVAFKDCVYLVEARSLDSLGADVNTAYARIVDLFTDTPLVIDGYGTALIQFEEDIEMVEVDDVDPSIRWSRCGGHLHVMIAASTESAPKLSTP
jgi:hypothetical protein